MYPAKSNMIVSENALKAIDGEAAFGLDVSKPSFKIQVTSRIPKVVTVALGYHPRVSEGLKIVESEDFAGTVIGLFDGKIAQLLDSDGDAVADNDIVVESLSDISVKEMQELLIVGAVQLTEGIHRVVGNTLQTTEGLVYNKFDHRGPRPEKLNLGIIKGQEKTEDSVLGPYRFPSYVVLGGQNRSLEYKLLPASTANPCTVILEFFYSNYVNMPELLERQLLRAKS